MFKNLSLLLFVSTASINPRKNVNNENNHQIKLHLSGVRSVAKTSHQEKLLSIIIFVYFSCFYTHKQPFPSQKT